MENAGKIIRKGRLYEQIWGKCSATCDKIIMVYIRHLCEKIKNFPSPPRRLVTVKGLGYKLRSGSEA